jgi:hypothetical protein
MWRTNSARRTMLGTFTITCQRAYLGRIRAYIIAF